MSKQLRYYYRNKDRILEKKRRKYRLKRRLNEDEKRKKDLIDRLTLDWNNKSVILNNDFVDIEKDQKISCKSEADPFVFEIRRGKFVITFD